MGTHRYEVLFDIIYAWAVRVKYNTGMARNEPEVKNSCSFADTAKRQQSQVNFDVSYPPIDLAAVMELLRANWLDRNIAILVPMDTLSISSAVCRCTIYTPEPPHRDF